MNIAGFSGLQNCMYGDIKGSINAKMFEHDSRLNPF
jgi:hypothetical protein